MELMGIYIFIWEGVKMSYRTDWCGQPPFATMLGIWVLERQQPKTKGKTDIDSAQIGLRLMIFFGVNNRSKFWKKWVFLSNLQESWKQWFNLLPVLPVLGA